MEIDYLLDRGKEIKMYYDKGIEIEKCVEKSELLTIIKQYNYYLGEEIELLKEQIMLEREYPGVLKAMREENAYLPDFEDNTLDIERIHLKEKKLEDKFKEQSHPKFDTTKTTKDLREILNTKNDKNPIFNFYDENR